VTVATTYFGGLGSVVEPDETAEVLGVVRYPQDFVDRVVDRNVPALAPPEELLQAYKAVEGAAEDDDNVVNPSAVAWRSVGFEARYRDHLAKSGQQQVLDNVRERLREHVDVWLVCWEKDVRYCHRRLLADVLVDELGVDVEHYPAPDEIEDEPVDVDAQEDEPRPGSLADFEDGGRR
jgi:uncharacterized protein YeaO (DUF488 family)